jgi:hypothetical protein
MLLTGFLMAIAITTASGNALTLHDALAVCPVGARLLLVGALPAHHQRTREAFSSAIPTRRDVSEAASAENRDTDEGGGYRRSSVAVWRELFPVES